MDELEFYDQSALLARLTSALKKRPREVIFLVGSPLSAPASAGLLGVPNVSGMIDIIRGEFADDHNLLNQLDILISTAKDKRYQEAFRFLQSRRGPAVANELVRSAVLAACKPEARYRGQSGDEQSCQLLEADDSLWAVLPGGSAIASLITHNPDIFGKSLLTTNFDPLLEVAIGKAGGRHYRTIMQGDGNVSITSAVGCHVIHLHGYWYGSNTLHTLRQLTQQRPQLKASLNRLIRDRIVVVIAYGGWDDIFTTTLLEMVADDADNTEILWTTRSASPSFPANIAAQLKLAADKAKVLVYGDIDCNVFLPELASWWLANSVGHPLTPPVPVSPVKFESSLITQMTSAPPKNILLEGDLEDRPPVIEFCLGREAELVLLEAGSAVVFITGIGGEGKSTIAAKAFGDRQKQVPDNTYVWRDCKEEGERFENQLAAIVESLTSGRVQGLDLAKQEIQIIVDILIPLLTDKSFLFVFDNIDHYVDLETLRLTSSVEHFVTAVLERAHTTKLIFTSRPSIQFTHPSATTIRLKGLTLSAAKALFVARGAVSSELEIEDAHEVTNGHAFWLDLLAIQVAKQLPGSSLRTLVDEIRRGTGELPNNMLNSIWSKLRDRERTVLRAMAETVRPEREKEIADYVSSEMNFQKVFKALRTLRSANLVVVKRLRGGRKSSNFIP